MSTLLDYYHTHRLETEILDDHDALLVLGFVKELESTSLRELHRHLRWETFKIKAVLNRLKQVGMVGESKSGVDITLLPLGDRFMKMIDALQTEETHEDIGHQRTTALSSAFLPPERPLDHREKLHREPPLLELPVGVLGVGSIRAEDIQRMLQQEEGLPASARRKLLKQYFRAVLEQRQAQFKAAIQVEKVRLGAIQGLARARIAEERNTLFLQIREEYVKTMQKLGHNVETSQLEFMTDFWETLEKFKQRLMEKDLDPKEKESILELARRSFEHVSKQFAELTDRILDTVKKETDD